jgi:hypothetical protein
MLPRLGPMCGDSTSLVAVFNRGPGYFGPKRLFDAFLAFEFALRGNRSGSGG